MEITTIYDNYKNAMGRNKPDSILEYEKFESHMLNYSKIAEYKNSVILYQIIEGYKIPSHFAPASLREGVEMIKKSLNRKYIFFITKDMENMLQKIGYKSMPFSISCFFRDKIVSKKMMVGSYREGIDFIIKVAFSKIKIIIVKQINILKKASDRLLKKSILVKKCKYSLKSYS